MSKVIRLPRPDRAGLADGADHPGGGAAEQRGDRVCAHRRGRQPPAIRLHDAELPGEAAAAPASPRTGRGSGRSPAAHRRTAAVVRGALELAEFRARPRGEQAMRSAGSAARDQRVQAQLMRRRDIGREQADARPPRSRRPPAPGSASSRTAASSSGRIDGAGRVDPLRHLEAVAPRDRRLRFRVVQIVDVPPVVALQEQDVAEARAS